jgi:hypothetical protein
MQAQLHANESSKARESAVSKISENTTALNSMPSIRQLNPPQSINMKERKEVKKSANNPPN